MTFQASQALAALDSELKACEVPYLFDYKPSDFYTN